MKNIHRAWAVCLGCTLAGVSYGLGAMLPASILMLRWFSSRRGSDIGICAAGTGISAVIFSPILSALIERFSLRACFYFEVLVSLLAAIAVFLLIRETPEACGLAPYGTREEASSSEKQKLSIHPSRLRWAMLYLGVILIGSIASPGFAHMMILFTSSGFSGAQAAFPSCPAQSPLSREATRRPTLSSPSSPSLRSRSSSRPTVWSAGAPSECCVSS